MEMLPKTYDPTHIEKHWRCEWERAGYAKPQGNGAPYCIVLPPPNVTGSLHMGHGFQQTLMDILIRYHRMQGDKTLWQVGTDHAGIATQMVVERQLAAHGLTRHDLGRSAFIEKVWAWKETSGSRITEQIRQLGASVDWERERFSMDPGLCEAVKTVFIQLYEQGLLYRGKRLVNWDPKFHTAISDLEVINKEQLGHLWHIRYPLSQGTGYLVVATTRPETLLGDTAVAVHPEDTRYQHLIGQKVRLPLCDREIPIIADEYVDPSFGSGCVKITPAHDFNDYEVGMRHNLPFINLFTIDACLNEQAPKVYQGLERFEARKCILQDLEALGLIDQIVPHTLQVPYGDRSDVVIEPLLTDQWFVKAKSLAGPAIAAYEKGELRFIPESWGKTYLQWLENIEDWCISRQLWWGHRIPAWYDEKGQIYVGPDEASIRARHQLDDSVLLHQDEDVLDTWFSAALWPMATLGWPERTAALDTFYPTHVLVTGFDILFFWVARMVMMGLHFMGKVPFKEVYVTGLIRDSQGQKMSKSKGNVLDPLDVIQGIPLKDLIEKRTGSLMQSHLAQKIAEQTRTEFPDGIPAFGTDALRFTYAALASTGRNINFSLGRVDGYRNFCNKIWNAARFVLMQCEGASLIEPDATNLTLADQWIGERLQLAITQTHEHLQTYRFDLMAQCLYEFIWNEYCDWYLEFAKVTLYAGTGDIQKSATRFTLINTLEYLLRLIHPIMPFISEEIWQALKPFIKRETSSIMEAPYPMPDSSPIDPRAQSKMNQLQAIVMAIRNIRSEMNVPPSKMIEVFYEPQAQTDKCLMAEFEPYLSHLAKVSQISVLNGSPPPSATTLAHNLPLHIPLADMIDPVAEAVRLDKAIQKLESTLTQSQNKLDNPTYLEKAPANVVEKERLKWTQTLQELNKLKTQRALLAPRGSQN